VSGGPDTGLSRGTVRVAADDDRIWHLGRDAVRGVRAHPRNRTGGGVHDHGCGGCRHTESYTHLEDLFPVQLRQKTFHATVDRAMARLLHVDEIIGVND
jgi:hypothetical protein